MTRLRPAFTLLETLLFLGILSIMASTIVAVYIATQETRVRQKSVAAVEQTGTQIVDTITRTIRRSEKVLAPATNQTGSILTLQMASNAEFPSVFARESNGNLTLVQKTETAALLTSGIMISNLTFRNVGDANVFYSFDIGTTVPTVPSSSYSRRFSATVTLFPDDQSEAGGCGSCTAPVCSNGTYRWHHCDNGACAQADVTIPC